MGRIPSQSWALGQLGQQSPQTTRGLRLCTRPYKTDLPSLPKRMPGSNRRAEPVAVCTRRIPAGCVAPGDGTHLVPQYGKVPSALVGRIYVLTRGEKTVRPFRRRRTLGPADRGTGPCATQLPADSGPCGPKTGFLRPWTAFQTFAERTIGRLEAPTATTRCPSRKVGEHVRAP